MPVTARRFGRRTLASLLFAGLAAVLAACSSLSSDDSPCPPVTIVPDAARLVRYAGGADLTDVVFETSIESVTPVCQRTDTELLLDMSVVLTARRGPAMTEERANFSYFVAVTSADQQLLARQEFPVSIPLVAEGRRVRLTDLVQPKLPLTKEQSPYSYRIYIGFVLTHEELRQNRGG